jgi:alanyl-tRNA synthetase
MEATRRLYHEDPERRTFRARVLAARPGPEGTTEVVLDETAFYPTGGGQPHDTGLLAGAAVVDVIEDGEQVIHRVRGEAPSGTVEGTIDWERRQDHRQQHSGQHVLSRAFIEVAEAATVGFHLGSRTCTIDLDRGVEEGDLQRAEDRANAVVRSGEAVGVAWYARPEDLPSGLRKEAPAGAPIRIVSMGSFDATPCCGTHCARTGDIGAIKILGSERVRAATRVTFVCGERARADHERRLQTLRAAAQLLTTEAARVPERIEALLAELKGTRSALERAEDALRENLLEHHGRGPAGPIAIDLGEGRSGWLVALGPALAERRQAPVLLGSVEGSEARVALAFPPGRDERAGERARALLEEFGGRGGGSDRLGQGKVPARRWPELLTAWKGREGA